MPVLSLYPSAAPMSHRGAQDSPAGRPGPARSVGMALTLCLFSAGPVWAEVPAIVDLPGGPFTFGTDLPRQGPPSRREVSGLTIGRHEVTVGQFRAFVAATGYEPPVGCFDWGEAGFADDPEARWDDARSAPSEDHPVVCVRWADAVAYAEWLSGQTGTTWRLPSESEWEFAAKGGDPAPQPLAPQTACDYANLHDAASAAAGGPALAPLPCNDGFARTAPVGGRKPNGAGLFDTLGNVSEWTASCWRETHDALQEDCARHVVRGGAWKDDLIQASTTNRVGLFEDFRSRYFGFRLVREP